ncbi:MAG: hypothetical protein KAJ03_04290 [Gammaproteobacteria bacterium]|nr:hypothetical protein [Gammaproteobacteria bacterium]
MSENISRIKEINDRINTIREGIADGVTEERREEILKEFDGLGKDLIAASVGMI